jgi:hypothetical protein
MHFIFVKIIRENMPTDNTSTQKIFFEYFYLLIKNKNKYGFKNNTFHILFASEK